MGLVSLSISVIGLGKLGAPKAAVVEDFHSGATVCARLTTCIDDDHGARKKA
jgi:hypothetical protein